MNNLQTRMVSAFGFGVLFILSIYASPLIAMYAFAGIGMIGIWEWMRIGRGKSNPINLGLAIVFILATIFFTIPFTPLSMSIICGCYLVFAWMNLNANPKSNIKITSIGLLYLLISSIIFIQFIGRSSSYFEHLMLTLFFIWGSDVGAYFIGKNFGKRKLAVYISPNKTVEGFFGGLGFNLIVGLIATLITEYNFIIILFGVLIHITSVIGDLLESKYKRIYRVKDSGKIIPGHGGILDRFDGLFFASPFIYLFFQLTDTI